MTDAAGTRTFAYKAPGGCKGDWTTAKLLPAGRAPEAKPMGRGRVNEYDELISDSLRADKVNHLITATMDSYGRSTGYTYAKGGSVQQTVSYGYGTDGRLNTAGFTHGGEAKQFSYKAGDGVSPISRTAGAPGGRGRERRDRGSYLPGTHLLQTLTMPNGMTLMQQYEQQRDLLTAMLYKRGETSVVERFYSYDTLGRPTARTENRQGGTRNDAFAHNDRSELTAATLGTANYAYAYDNIGNRKTAQENAEEVTNYDANNLNQYTAVGSFTPEFDADGNQTRVQTSTGIWNVTYNAENRPLIFTRENEDGTQTRVTCAYDYMGRRATKKVETIATDAETEESTASTTLNQRYLYRGYLQVACCDLTRSAHPCLWLITWDPTQPTATRPLAIQKDATWYTYGWDLTKNICEVFGSDGYIKTVYSYAPFGAVAASGTVTQPFQWSSEFYDDEQGLVYYNYRHYNSLIGRWLCYDPLEANSSALNEYTYTNNRNHIYDILGLVYEEYKLVRVPTNGVFGTVNAQFNQSKNQIEVEIEKWIMPSWYNWLTPPQNTGERSWRATTQEELNIYFTKKDGIINVESDSHILYSRAQKEVMNAIKMKEQIQLGNTILETAASFIPISNIFNTGRLVHFTSHEGFVGIKSSGKLIGEKGIFAIPVDSHIKCLATGRFANPKYITIPQQALNHFHKVKAIGPYSIIKRIYQTHYTAPGEITIKTGKFVKTGSILKPMSALYLPDISIYAIAISVWELITDDCDQ